MNRRIAVLWAVLIGLCAIQSAHAAEFHRPSAYAERGDSPFAALELDSFFLEDFEDAVFDAPGVTHTASAFVLGPSFWTDSVDGDDGTVDGQGQKGHTLFHRGDLGFFFDTEADGGLPTHVGIVWTDGGFSTRFEAFDSAGESLGTIGPFDLGDDVFSGTTGEDRFFGVVHPRGISAIFVRNPAGIEVDHLQYGTLTEAVTFPLDIKPGGCPNSVNVKSRGILPAAVLGMPERDVSSIDAATVVLTREGVDEGVAPVKVSTDDVGSGTPGETCECSEAGPDGVPDLVLKFKTQDLVEALGLDALGKGESHLLTLEGVLTNGERFTASDCVRLVGR